MSQPLQDEEEWEAAVLNAALGTALRPDGSINFDELRAKGQNVCLDEMVMKFVNAEIQAYRAEKTARRNLKDTD